MSQEPLPYSVSSGSAYSAFEKLQGAKNYATWKHNMQTVLLSLRQWEVVAGTEGPPTPAHEGPLTAEETKELRAWQVREVSAFMEISFRVADSVMGDTRSSKTAWTTLEQ